MTNQNSCDDDKKQHFDDIYVENTPVRYKTEILDALSYVSDDFNRAMFDAHILAPLMKLSEVQFVDLCGCFGNTTMACAFGYSYAEIKANWADETACMTLTQPKRRFENCTISAIDLSGPALEYGKKAGIYDRTIQGDLNEVIGTSADADKKEDILATMAGANVFICTAALVYLDLSTIQELVKSFASGDGEGYCLVNFLNPFSLEKADATKRILLEHLEFVGSRATRHRKLSPLERSAAEHADEEWALLELWVLKRRS